MSSQPIPQVLPSANWLFCCLAEQQQIRREKDAFAFYISVALSEGLLFFRRGDNGSSRLTPFCLGKRANTGNQPAAEEALRHTRHPVPPPVRKFTSSPRLRWLIQRASSLFRLHGGTGIRKEDELGNHRTGGGLTATATRRRCLQSAWTYTTACTPLR